MSEIGYYRYKVSDTTSEQIVNWFKNGALAKVCTVIARPFCEDYRLVKYLNKDGQYLFFPFNKHWQQSDKPTLIGKVNTFVASLVTAQSSERNIGYKTEKKITLTAETVSLEELERLEDLYDSPRVYLYIGNGTTDRVQDWILVTITGDGISRPKKQNFKKVSIDITLPEQYAVTQI